MSILLSKLSERTKQNIWYRLTEFADTLSAEFNLKSLISKIIELYENACHCSARIWLDPVTFDSVSRKNVQDEQLLENKLFPLMETAYQERKIVTTEMPLEMNNPESFSIAIPLLVKDQLLGVVQLEQKSITKVAEVDIEFCVTLTYQFAIGLYYLNSMTQNQYRQRINDFSNKIAEISKSILTNLDRNSLFNNLVTLLHQYFRYQQVNLVLKRSDRNKSLKKISIIDGELSVNDNYLIDEDNHSIAWSIEHELPKISNNVALGLTISTPEGSNGIQATCCMPLFDGETFLGVIELCASDTDIFGPETINNLFELAEAIGVAIRNANTFHTEQIKRQIYDRLSDIAGLLSADVSFESLEQKLLNELEIFIPWDVAAIWLFDEEEESSVEQYKSILRFGVYRISEGFKQKRDQASIFEKFISLNTYYEQTFGEEELFSVYPWFLDLLSSTFPVIREDTSIHEPLGEMLGFCEEYSAIGALFSTDNQPLGILIVVNEQSNCYDFDSQIILNAFIDVSSIILRNSKLYLAAHNQAWISTVQLQVAEVCQSMGDLDELLNSITRMLPPLLGVEACAIFLWDSPISAFLPNASFGFSSEQTELFNTFDVFPGIVPAFDDLRQDQKPVVLNNDALSAEIASSYFPDYDFASNLVILFPLISQNSFCGAILIDFTNSDLDINSSQVIWDEKYTLIEGVSRQVAAAIENLQLIKSQEEEAYISIALLQVAQAIVSYNDLQEILSSIVRITPILVGVKRAIIYLWDEANQIFHQSEYYGFSKPELKLLGELVKGYEFPFIEAIQQEMKILYHTLRSDIAPDTWKGISIRDYQAIEYIAYESRDDISIRFNDMPLLRTEKLLIGFPLSITGEFLGVMLIEEEDPGRSTTSLHIREKRIEILQGITQQAAIAIKKEILQQEAVKSERMERELQLAREIQSAFLPEKLPQLPGWGIDARWQPARQVAGDFYDVLMLDPNRVGIVIADVADKGMPAALFMTLIRTLLRAAAREELSPAVVLKQVNNLLVPDSKNSMFVTVFYGVLSLDTGKFNYANAGHNPPVIKRKNMDALIELTTTSMALGIFDDIDVGEKEVYLYPGDWILLYTDGVTEAFSPNEELFGTSRLYELIQSISFSSTKEILDRIENTVYEFISGNDIADDMTLAVIHRN